MNRTIMCSVSVLALLATPTMGFAQEVASPASTPAPTTEPAPATTPAPEASADAPGSTVVVRESRRGRVPGADPEIVITSEQIQALGASNLFELLQDIQNLTQARRGRITGPPVVLINGRRVSSFRDVARLPPEAIERLEVLPEEAALRFGFTADQRVINVILKDRFTATTIELGARNAAEGNLSGQRYDFTFVNATPTGRLTIDGRFLPSSEVLESDRGVLGVGRPGSPAGSVLGLGPLGQIDPALSALAGQTVTSAGFTLGGVGLPTLSNFVAQANNPTLADQANVRSLVPANDVSELNANYVLEVTESAEITFSARHTRDNRENKLGYAGFSAILPETSSFSPFASDVRVSRLLTEETRPLIIRETDNNATRIGATASGRWLDTWQWSVDTAFEENERISVTRNELNNAAISTAIAAGTLNPFGASSAFGAFSAGPRLSEDVTTIGEIIANTSGILLEALPAGPLRGSFRLSGRERQLGSLARSDAGETREELSRTETVAFASFELPITMMPEEGFNFIGSTSLTLSGTVRELSDFGTLQSIEASVKWEPTPWMTVTTAYAKGDAAPSIEQLGGAVDIQPNVPILDPISGQSVLATVTSGGNRNLRATNQTDRSVTLSLRPLELLNPERQSQTQLSLDFTLSRNAIVDGIADIPALSAEIEAAFPERFQRDSSGRLIGLDRRAFNVARNDSESFRWAVNFGGLLSMGGASGGRGGPPAGAGGPPSGAAGPPTGAGGPPSGAPGSGPPSGAPAGASPTGPAPAAGGPPGGAPAAAGPPGPGGMPSSAQLTSMMRSGGGTGPPRFNINLSHTISLDQEILIRPGVAPLFPLDGQSLNGAAGVPRHNVALNANAFLGIVGFNLNLNWASESELVTPTTTLFFEDRVTSQLRGFVTLTQIMPFVRENPWLDGTRFILRVNNLTDSAPEVRDSNGNTPPAYQRQLLEPTGRSIEFAIRKLF